MSWSAGPMAKSASLSGPHTTTGECGACPKTTNAPGAGRTRGDRPRPASPRRGSKLTGFEAYMVTCAGCPYGTFGQRAGIQRSSVTPVYRHSHTRAHIQTLYYGSRNGRGTARLLSG